MINGNARMVPRLQYHAQDLKQWVGWLLSRPAIEEEVWDGLNLALQVGECTYFVRDNAMGVAGAA